jgi:hypothetical protein
MDLLNHRAAAVLGCTVLVPLLMTACSSGSGASSASTAASSAMPQEAVALTAAACGEITRLTREEMDGLVDDDPADWDRFAAALQSIADGAADPAFRTATTEMATAALSTAESLRAGNPLGPALTAFEDTVPAVDSVCKRVAAPLN